MVVFVFLTLDYFSKLKIFSFNFGIVSFVVLGEWIRGYCVIIVIIIRNVRVLKHHSVASTKQVFITNATGFLDDVRRVRRY